MMPDEFVQQACVDSLNMVANLTSEQVTTKGNQTALEQFLKQACRHIQDDEDEKAQRKFEDVRARTDGCVLRGEPDVGSGLPGQGPLKDYVIDCEAQGPLYGLLSDAIDALGL
jgi:hypothetical protein